jgi:hypothetical protein
MERGSGRDTRLVSVVAVGGVEPDGAGAVAAVVHRIAQPSAARCSRSPDGLNSARPAIEDEPATGRDPVNICGHSTTGAPPVSGRDAGPGVRSGEEGTGD